MRRACSRVIQQASLAWQSCSSLGTCPEASSVLAAPSSACSCFQPQEHQHYHEHQQSASFSTFSGRPAWHLGQQAAGLHVPHLHRGLSVKTQSTPNPQSLMFMPSGQRLLEGGSQLFTDAESAKAASPLAARLFALEGVASVMFGTDFITVTKSSEELPWAQLKHDVTTAIQQHFASGQPVMHEGSAAQQASDAAAQTEDDNEIVSAIKELLETRIRPAVQEDGGDILFRGFDPETGVVTVRMMGSCSGCPSSTVTLKSGVENMLMHYVPEVTGVEEEVTEAETESAKALARLEATLAQQEKQGAA